jgi:hypothetical protein
MNLRAESYLEQSKCWPSAGRHILAQYDAETVVVYQAYRPSIGQFAVQNQRFGGDFSFNRMSWVKPNFLWMMYRSGWGRKEGQEITLAVRLCRSGFDRLLEFAVHSAFSPDTYESREQWRERLATSPVRLQWDPDHDPYGAKLERRAIQIGLTGEILRQHACDWIVEIEDISEFVVSQRAHLGTNNLENLVTPREEIYPVNNPEIAKRVGIDQRSHERKP